MEKKKKTLGVYIHIPFCVRKCKYCDFLSFSGKEEQMASYVAALKKEISTFFEQNPDYEISSVYLGGGTPSLLPPDLTSQLLEFLFSKASLATGAEITTEANPGTINPEKANAWKKAGINRISIGLQSTKKKELSYLGRIHSYEDFLKSYDLIRKTGFDNVNVDLMSAIPYQTEVSWEETLTDVLTLSPEHISAYSLIVEEGTPFYEDPGLEKLLPDEETERLMYERTGELLLEKGYQRYEISNYATEGRECRHNLLYWDREDYIGFGLGASSCIGNERFSNTNDLASYLSTPYRNPKKRREWQSLTLREQMEEEMILGLRKMKGVSASRFFKRYGCSMMDVFGTVIARYEKEGLLKWKGDNLAFTKRGLDLSNVVLCEFLS